MITLENVKEHLKIDHNNDDELIQLLLDGSKKYVLNYTGLSPEELENNQDICIAILVIISNIYDKRIYNDEIIHSLLMKYSNNLL